MFACIYFSEDDSLSVVGKADKKLQFREDGWKEKEQVEMKWGRKDYNGTIIRIHGTFYLTFSMYVLHSDVSSIKISANKYEFNVIFLYHIPLSMHSISYTYLIIRFVNLYKLYNFKYNYIRY